LVLISVRVAKPVRDPVGGAPDALDGLLSLGDELSNHGFITGVHDFASGRQIKVEELLSISNCGVGNVDVLFVAESRVEHLRNLGLVDADSWHISLVLHNLVSNAIDTLTVGAVLSEGSHKSVLETFSDLIGLFLSGSNLLCLLINGAFFSSPVVGTFILIVLSVVSAENVAVSFLTNVPALLDVAVLTVEVLKVIAALVEVLAFP